MNLCVENLSYSFDGVHDLWKDVSFAVEKGDIFSIMGANGAGKSTLLHTVIGFLRPKTGQVYLENEGQKIYADTAPKLFTENIGYVPQLSDTAYSFAVKDYVVMGRSPHMGLFSQPSAKDREMADEVMQDMGVYEIRNRRFNTLSGGQQRQAVIARAVVQEPHLIIMDEPTNHLDYGNQFRVVEMIEKLSEKGITVILTTHMPDQALYLGHRAGILSNRKLSVGNAKDIITEEALEEIYRVKVRLSYVEEAKRIVCIPGI